MNRRFKRVIQTTAILASITLVGQTPLMADESAADLQEIIVTAQKRAQSLQEVPISVQVVGADQLAAAGVVNFEDFNRIAPSLLINTAVKPTDATVAIRGIGTFAFGIGVEPSVGMVVDGVPLGFQARAFANLQDVSQVEVLAGPQSTLYGKSTTAGLVIVTTPAPSKSWTEEAHVTATNDSERQVSGSVSGPLADTLLFRLSANYDDFPGNVNELYTGGKSDGALNFATHGKVLWTPSDKFDAEFNINYMKGQNRTDYVWINLPANANLRGNAAYPPSVFLHGVVPGSTNQSAYDMHGIGNLYGDAGESVNLSYNLGGPSLVLIAAHDRYFIDDHQTVDYTAVVPLDDWQHGNFHSVQWSEELRLVSPSSGAFQYTFGLYHAEVEDTRDFTRGPVFSLARWNAAEGSNQISAYGQIDYSVTDKLILSGGGSVGQERINYFFNDHLILPPAKNYFSGVNSKDYATYKIGPEYHLTDDIMLYTFHSTGHKGATWDLGTGFASKANGGFVQPETSSDYELGAKMQFLSHRLTVNPDVFTTTYNNFQAQNQQILPNGSYILQLANVGQIRTRGFESMNSLRLDNDWSIGLSPTYLDATILSYPSGPCYGPQVPGAGTCLKTAGSTSGHQNLSGTRMADAPRWKVVADTSYVHPLGFLPFDGVYRASYTYTGTVNYSISQDPTTIQKAYGILNLSAGMKHPDGRYELTFFVNNALNKHYHQMFNDIAGTFSNTFATQAMLPRDFDTYGGVTLSAKF